ncbi:aldehyde dehydrogenase family protein [Oceanicoccus sagamiensis]|uniref:Aldehyde dehydrogenase n=1 Tax=Oceanicoccus sagamiensis TaxID=716816 RepID=A0A1X9N7J3_9GAMM|nr:aldehyde dehydrogenase family protein [Oceanicoccus sagamiensis]ARN73094.1 aldehyde dehydrogenase [Oceanicoccus sagamiensis]
MNSETSVSEINRIFQLQSKHQWLVKRSTAEQRIAKLARLKSAIQSREAAIRAALYADLRKSPEGDEAEITGCYTDIDDAINNLAQWMKPVDIESSPGLEHARPRLTYEAKGIVLLFGPWNFPFCLVFQPLVAIVAAGNCALVKPNEMAPHISKVTAEIIRDVFDEQEVAVFEGGVELANQLLEQPINHVFFTGSPAVGKIVMAAAAQHLASVTLELGGKNPVVIDRTANIQEAAQKVAAWRNMNNGQVCLCPENIWVHEEQKEAFIATVQATYQAMFYVDGALNTEATGKIIDERNLQRVKGYIDDAREKGATVVCGGEVENQAVHPTLLTDVPADAKILAEEVFGPILSVFTYNDIDEVITTLQQQPKPLAMYLFTESNEFVELMLQNTSSGGVTVNDCAIHYLERNLPFGGVNTSGIGRYHSIHGFKELSHERAVLHT